MVHLQVPNPYEPPISMELAVRSRWRWFLKKSSERRSFIWFCGLLVAIDGLLVGLFLQMQVLPKFGFEVFLSQRFLPVFIGLVHVVATVQIGLERWNYGIAISQLMNMFGWAISFTLLDWSSFWIAKARKLNSFDAFNWSCYSLMCSALCLVIFVFMAPHAGKSWSRAV